MHFVKYSDIIHFKTPADHRDFAALPIAVACLDMWIYHICS